MRVIYLGRLPVLVAEYNGTRYALVKNTPKDIPVKVYDYVKSSGHMMAGDLVPDVESYEKEIEDLKLEVKRLSKIVHEPPKEKLHVRKTSKKK